jgi:NADH dehydrogenase FAD-containing subunit
MTTIQIITSQFNTLGVKEHARFLKDVGDARKIRRRVLECFEIAASPASTEDIRRQILHFAIVGGGPTGIEYAATLHDLIFEDLRHLYPELMEEVSITVYDVAPNVLSMFDTKLAEYAQQTLKRENIKVRTSRHIVSLEPGLPGQSRGDDAQGHPAGILTLTTKEEGAEGVGMCVWATGLAQNPFVESCFTAPALNPNPDIISTNDTQQDATTQDWKLAKHEKTGSIITDQQLRVLLEPTSSTSSASKDEAAPRATLKDVFAMGDCAITQNTSYPATAQVASQKAYWLAARLNKNDLDNNNNKFEWKNLGTMAYLGGWTGIAQGIGGLGDVSGRTAWIIWKGAYLVKTLSWRNRILVLVYWCTNWASGRDVSRF